jgi:hypothetical protein
MVKKIDDDKSEFEKLTTTRKNQLEKPLRRIEQLREETGIKVTPDNSRLISNGNDSNELLDSDNERS